MNTGSQKFLLTQEYARQARDNAAAWRVRGMAALSESPAKWEKCKSMAEFWDATAADYERQIAEAKKASEA